MCHSLFFNNIVGLRTATLLKKRFWRRCFPVTPMDDCFCQLTFIEKTLLLYIKEKKSGKKKVNNFNLLMTYHQIDSIDESTKNLSKAKLKNVLLVVLEIQLRAYVMELWK